MSTSMLNGLTGYAFKAAKIVLKVSWKLFKGTVAAGIALGLGAIGAGNRR